jgi:anthranilate synthase component 1
VAKSGFQYIVERLSIAVDRGGAVPKSLVEESLFTFQRAKSGAASPDFTYIGLEVETISRATAEFLCSGEDNADSVVALDSGDRYLRIPFKGGVFVFLPYEYSDDLPTSSPQPIFELVRRLVVVDHGHHDAYLMQLISDDKEVRSVREDMRRWITDFGHKHNPTASGLEAEKRATAWSPDCTFKEYAARFDGIQRSITKGGLRQAILSVGMSKTTTASAGTIFDVLQRRNSSPHTFLFRAGRMTVVGSSPAMHLRKVGDLLTVETDAGTRRAGKDEEETRAVMKELLSSAKDLDEQKMIVEETIADLAVIAADGHVDVPVKLEVRRLGNVMHLYTVLQARLKPGISSIEAVTSCFPPAAVTGVPKKAAMACIRGIERTERGPYAGVVGLLGLDGSVDTAIILRSAWIFGNRISLRCGGGITAASVSADEYQECMNKAQAMIECVALAETTPTR